MRIYYGQNLRPDEKERNGLHQVQAVSNDKQDFKRLTRRSYAAFYDYRTVFMDSV